MRYFITVAYDGTNFYGWQKQPNALGVQQKVEEVFSTILNRPIDIMGSGRTDAGVHASKQVFHVDLEEGVSVDSLLYNANKMLTKDVALLEAKAVNPDAHARFEAVSRSYQYKIITQKDPFSSNFAYYFTKELEIEKMNAAADLLLQFTDFESFSKVKTDVNTFNCIIFEAVWKQENGLLVFHVSANRFLRGMVRAIVGTLLEVGLGKITTLQFKEIIEKRNRNAAGRSVPAHGLFLTEVKYPEEVYL